MKSCSFTGHRIIEEEYIAPLSDLLIKAIEYVYAEGCRNFYCGGALGFDTMAAKTLISMRIKYSDIRLCIVVPCKNQSENWSVAEMGMYDFILSAADEVIYTSEEYKRGCMRIRNKRLAELCDIMIAFCGREKSGSSQTVKMASDMGKKIFNLYPRIAGINISKV